MCEAHAKILGPHGDEWEKVSLPQAAPQAPRLHDLDQQEIVSRKGILAELGQAEKRTCLPSPMREAIEDQGEDPALIAPGVTEVARVEKLLRLFLRLQILPSEGL